MTVGAFRIGDAVWVVMYRGQEEVQVPATIIALQEGAGGYVVRGDESPNAVWMTVESLLLPREGEPTATRTCPACEGVLTVEACADCDATGQCVGVDVEDRVWSEPCAWCGGLGGYPVCKACGWGGENDGAGVAGAQVVGGEVEDCTVDLETSAAP